jgi:hypothetical protein
MTTERAAALTDTAPAGVEADPGLNPSDQPETDQPGAKPAADPTAEVSMPRNRNVSAETQRLYAADWRAFEDWCREQSLVPLAADATTVAAFLTQGAKTLSAGALSRRAAAIAKRHRQSGFVSPAADPAVTAILRAAYRTRQRRLQSKQGLPISPVTHAMLNRSFGMSVLKRVGSVAVVVGLAAVGVAAMPHNANAWWRGGVGVGIWFPPVVVAPPVYAPPPAYYYPPPPVYYPYPPPRRVWVPPHWEGPYWIRGHWA